MLKEIRIVSGKNTWSILMNEYPYLPPVEWRIAATDSQAERTSLSLEIHNAHPDREQCFQTFDQLNPLVLIDNKGQSVPMVKVGALPEGILNSSGIIRRQDGV